MEGRGPGAQNHERDVWMGFSSSVLMITLRGGNCLPSFRRVFWGEHFDFLCPTRHLPSGGDGCAAVLWHLAPPRVSPIRDRDGPGLIFAFSGGQACLGRTSDFDSPGLSCHLQAHGPGHSLANRRQPRGLDLGGDVKGQQGGLWDRASSPTQLLHGTVNVASFGTFSPYFKFLPYMSCEISGKFKFS